MDILKALEIFKIDDIGNIDKSKIKRTFKVLMKSNHPDIGGNEEKAKLINIAYGVILDNIDRLKHIGDIENNRKEVVHNCLITIENLINIYNGENLKFGDENNSIILNRSNLRTNNIIIKIKASVVHGGILYNFEDYARLNNKDEYNIICKIETESISKPDKVRLIAYGINEEIEINYKSLARRIKLDYGVYLNIIMDRVLIKS